ncbi:MAG: alpha/beta fold hydrolase [Lachnospiraceae bacterium]|nr:alpha/beta fold hydrolase [Lachnospiraceae bacterium]
MKKEIKVLVAIGVAATAAMYVTNKVIERKTKLLEEEEPVERGLKYSFRHGDVYYVKKGEGAPILLLHDIEPDASHMDWKDSINGFTEGHCVYALDLPGCGKSEKPNFIYSNYMYVELINDFVRDVIGEKVTVIAEGVSCSAALMAANMNDDIIKKLIFVNPASLNELKQNPDRVRDNVLTVFRIPILGEFIYNMMYWNCDDRAFLAAHRDKNRGRFLLSSIIGRYTGINITHALGKAKVPVVILGDKKEAEGYRIFNDSIEILGA